MEFTLCYWFWSFCAVVLSLFILLIVIPVTIFFDFSLDFDYSIPLLFSWTIFLTIKIIAFLIWSRLFLPTCIDLSWSSSNSWFCMVLNSWLLYRYFHFWCFYPFPALLTFLFCFCSLLFVAIFTSTCVFSILFSFQCCCTRFEINFWCYLGLFTTSLIWSVIATIRTLISLFISLLWSLISVVTMTLIVFAITFLDDCLVVSYVQPVLFARASRSALKLRLFGLAAGVTDFVSVAPSFF